MSPRVLGPVRPIALIGMLLVSIAGVGLDTQAVPAAECLTAPKANTPKGSHWYYHTDRATKRKCWFLLGPNGQQQVATTSAKAKPAANRTATTGAKNTSTAGCLAAPNRAAPKGSHWYYHLDRATKRKCWHLRRLSEPAEAAPATPKTDAVLAAPATQSPQHAAAWMSPAPAKQDADSVWSAASAKPQSAAVGSDADDGPQSRPDMTRRARAEAPAPATFRVPAMSAGAPQDGDGQAAETTAAADRESQARSVVADAGKAITPPLLTRDARAEAAPSPDDPPASGAAKTTVPANDVTAREANADRVKNISQSMSGSASTPLGMLLIVVMALALTGILYRLTLTVLAMRGPRVIIDQSSYYWGEDRYDEASTLPQHVSEARTPSLVPAVAALKAPHPPGDHDGWLGDGRGSRLASANRIGRHEQRLMELTPELNRFLQSRNDK